MAKKRILKLNITKCNYMVFSRSNTKMATRIKINSQKIEKISVTKLLGLWISDDLSWSKNCKEICRKAYSRLSMITKLKYVGVGFQELIEIYILFRNSWSLVCLPSGQSCHP